jgi:hypothetical protein
MLLGAVAGMVLATGVAVSPASAAVPTQGKNGIGENSNVPYLAWRGEHVRVGFCVTPNVEASANLVTGANYTAGWVIEDWSGNPANGSIPVPVELPNTAGASDDCYYDTWSSQKSGVAFIKLTLTDPTTHLPMYYHQFTVIWMDMLAPVVSGGGQVAPADFCEYASEAKLLGQIVYSPGGFPVCDPDNDPRHHVKVTIKGNVPLLANFSEWGLGDHITLPDDWAKLAARAATCSSTYEDYYDDALSCHTPGSPGVISNWDIHDDSLLTEGHVNTSGQQCDTASETNLAGTTDAVDNCRVVANDKLVLGSWGTEGPFSTVFGVPSSTDTWGPFDPMFPNETLLSDGKVDAGDAPMPAARIDVNIVENNPANKTDISGVGYLEPSDKADIYSRDGTGAGTAHNLYAPYYSQYIPATSRPAVNGVYPSGIEGATAQGFNGYLVNGLYKNWNFAWEHSFHPNTDSECLWAQSYLPFNKYYRPLPYGTSSVSVYTDEAGEAVVDYIPALGFYFDNLLGANKNLNNGCDLEGVGTLGKATINTVARYPYQTVTAGDLNGNPVDFSVGNLFHKNLTVYSKGDDANGITSNSLAKIVLAHAQDIDGSPLAFEEVCWMTDADAEGARVFVGDLPAPTAEDPNAVIHLGTWHAFLTTGSDPWGMNRLCTFTDLNGNTAIEVYNSNGTEVDVIAEFVNEGILRHTFADFATGSLGGVTSADGPSVAQVPTPAQMKTVVAVGASGPVVQAKTTTPLIKTLKSKQAQKAVKSLRKLRFAKVVTPFKGKAKLQVRVNGKAGNVALKISFKQGKKTVTVTRFVAVNKNVTVKNLTIPAKTAKVTVRMIGL